MANVLVRDVPDDVHAALQRQAALRHQSLQQFLTAELQQLAERRSVAEVLDAVEKQSGGHVGFAVGSADIADERAGR